MEVSDGDLYVGVGKTTWAGDPWADVTRGMLHGTDVLRGMTVAIVPSAACEQKEEVRGPLEGRAESEVQSSIHPPPNQAWLQMAYFRISGRIRHPHTHPAIH